MWINVPSTHNPIEVNFGARMFGTPFPFHDNDVWERRLGSVLSQGRSTEDTALVVLLTMPEAMVVMKRKLLRWINREIFQMKEGCNYDVS